MLITGKQKALALAAHISYLFFGVGYILVPLAIYLIYDGKDHFVALHAKQALVAQALLGIMGAVVAGLTLVLVGFLLWPIMALLGLVWFIASLYDCFKVINGEDYRYPLLGRVGA
ncbi:MAG: DUF4870 domain-containing protein [Selenomonadaceae bacterium]|nr:DUF4870 domain-containing protein [Selenomonadaceae bacterium]